MHTNSILAGVALLLAVPTAYTIVAEQGSFTEYDTIPRLFEGFTPENIQFVVLTKAKEDGDAAVVPEPAGAQDPQADPKVDQLVFQRVDDHWVLAGQHELAGVPIQSSKVENDVLEHVQSIRRDEKALVQATADDEALAARGLTQKTGILIQCLNAERMPMAELYRGNDASKGEFGQDKVKGWFVARKDGKEIVLYEPTQPYWYLTVNPEDWIDKKVHEFQVDKVQSFAVRNPEGQMRFVREKKEGESVAGKDWVAETTPEGKGAVRQQEVNNLLARFNYVNASRYLGRLQNPQWNQKAPSPKDADVEVSVTLEDGTRYAMWVGKKIADKNEYYARFEGKAGIDQFLIAIGEWIRQPFVDKKIADFFDPTAEAVAPGGQGESGTGPAKTEAPVEPGKGGAEAPAPGAPPATEKSGGAGETPPPGTPPPSERKPGNPDGGASR